MNHTELVENVKKAAKQGGKEFGAGMALGEFAHLLGVLSEEADQTADKNLKISQQNLTLQKRVLIATWLVFGLTVLIFILNILQYSKSVEDNKGSNQANQSTQTK